jgi:hypothetical protein
MTSKKATISEKTLAALESVAAYIVDCEGREFEDYVRYCDDNGLNPSDIKGVENQKHVYAQTL